MWSLVSTIIGWVLSRFFGGGDKLQPGRDAQKVDDAAAVIKEVQSAKQIDAAVAKSADGAAAEQLQHDFSRD